MVKKYTFIQSITFFLGICLLFTGCNLFKELKYDEVYQDSNGDMYYIINKNHIDFSKNNVLEVVINESERFILYDYDYDAPDPNHSSERGVGEWIKDSISIPIYFNNDNYGYANYIHGDIEIWYGDYEGEDIRETPSDSIYIAKIKNDINSPELYWCVDGSYIYSPEYSLNAIPVKYRTYTRVEGVQDAAPPFNPTYVGVFNSPFYAVPEDTVALYRFEFENSVFEIDGKTGIGTWTTEETTHYVELHLDAERFSFSVRYAAEDENKGQPILSGIGTWLGAEKAVYYITYSCNELEDTVSTLSIDKVWILF